MKKSIIFSIFVLLLVFIGADIFYFKFHSYFQGNHVNDVLLTDTNGEVSILLMGNFENADYVHRGSGTARVVKQSDKYYLRLEDFKVTNGPDLFVYLGKTSDGNFQNIKDYKLIAPLKGNSGNQTYDITSEDMSANSVIIWCKQFGVLFSSASLRNI